MRGLRGGERALRPARRVTGQSHRALEERRRRGEPAARLRPAGGPLELRGDRLVGPGGGLRPMPRAPIRVGLGIGRLRQRSMHRAALVERGAAVDGRAHERMPEPHVRTQRHELRGRRGRGRVRVDTEPRRRPPHQRRVADGLSRGDQQQPPRRGRQLLQAALERRLDPARQRPGVR